MRFAKFNLLQRRGGCALASLLLPTAQAAARQSLGCRWCYHDGKTFPEAQGSFKGNFLLLHTDKAQNTLVINSNGCLSKVVVFLSIKIVLGRATLDLCCAAVPTEKCLTLPEPKLLFPSYGSFGPFTTHIQLRCMSS